MSRLADDLQKRRRERLVQQLMEQLIVHETLIRGVDYVEDVEEWRRAARIAGRRLGWVMRTGISRDGRKVWATEGP